MGYDLHITKKEFWADENGPVLKKEEWEKYVASDPEVIRDENNSVNDYLVKDLEGDWPIWWEPDVGEIYTKNPTEAAIKN